MDPKCQRELSGAEPEPIGVGDCDARVPSIEMCAGTANPRVARQAKLNASAQAVEPIARIVEAVLPEL